MVSSVHRGFNSSKAVFFSCMNSPSTRLAITVDISSTTSPFRSLANATEALPSMKSPARTAILLPKERFAEEEDLRIVELSITSSCSKDAVCINSAISARRLWEGRIWESVQAYWESIEEVIDGLRCGEGGLMSFNIADGEIDSLIKGDVEFEEILVTLGANEVACDISRTMSGRICLPSECV